MSVFHVAGHPVDLVQRCIRCDAVLIDYIGAMTNDKETRPMWFAPYRLVEHDGNSWIGSPNVPVAIVDANLCEQAHPVAQPTPLALGLALILLLSWCPVFAQIPPLPPPADHYELGMFRSTDEQGPTSTAFSTTIITPAMISCGHRLSDDPVDGIPNPSWLAWSDPADVTKECRIEMPTAVLSLPIAPGYHAGVRAVGADGTRSPWVYTTTNFRRAPRGIPCALGTGVEMSVSVDVNGKPAIATLCLQQQ